MIDSVTEKRKQCTCRPASYLYMSRIVRKPDFCLCENKGADQLRSNCEADQRLCFRYSDSIIPLLLIAKISSLLPPFETVQAGLCRTWSETRRPVFSFLNCTVNQSRTTHVQSHRVLNGCPRKELYEKKKKKKNKKKKTEEEAMYESWNHAVPCHGYPP